MSTETKLCQSIECWLILDVKLKQSDWILINTGSKSQLKKLNVDKYWIQTSIKVNEC